MIKSTKVLLGVLIGLIVVAGASAIYVYKIWSVPPVDTSIALVSPRPSAVSSLATTATTAARTASPTASPAASCGTICSEFTAEETATMADWLTYTNPTYNYCFRYPSGWTVSSDSAELVTARGTDSGEEITFQTREGRMTEIGFPEYSLTFTRDFTVNCESSTENTYDGADNLSMMVYNFTKSGNPYLLMYSFKDIGASYAGDMYNLGKMILKTFAFSS